MEEFLPIAILLVFAIALCAGLFILPRILGPQNPGASKLSTYECGVQPVGDAHIPFYSRYYVVAVLFLLFDVEAAFFFPWALIYRRSLSHGAQLFWAFLIYTFFVAVAFIYVYRKRALEANS